MIRAQLDISNFEWACIVSFFCVGGAFGSQIGGKVPSTRKVAEGGAQHPLT